MWGSRNQVSSFQDVGAVILQSKARCFPANTIDKLQRNSPRTMVAITNYTLQGAKILQCLSHSIAQIAPGVRYVGFADFFLFVFILLVEQK